MSTKTSSNHLIVLSDSEGQLYAIDVLKLNQYRMAGDRKKIEQLSFR